MGLRSSPLAYTILPSSAGGLGLFQSASAVVAPQIAPTVAPIERNSLAFLMIAPCFGSFHVSAPGNNNTLVSLTTTSSIKQSGMTVSPPIVWIGSFE